MFSFGQLIFGLCFFIVFIGVIIYSYKTDKKNQPKYFKGSYKILLGFLIAFSLLVLIKYLTQK
jgi:amino acid transporter|tara:strand:+ start:1247 stop:1435 length:189 start_codon:yes stop_codon:yes gene_type:complete